MWHQLFPLSNSEQLFSDCLSLKDFLNKVVTIYFQSNDARLKECCLSVYAGFRDHYPKYLVDLNIQQLEKMNLDLQRPNGKIIKLRRIVLSELAKVA